MNVIKIPTENIFIWFNDLPGKEKITFGLGEKGVHFTLMRKASERVFEFHKTVELEKGGKEYTILFRIKAFTVFRLLYILAKANYSFMRKHYTPRRINVGKMNRKKMILFSISSTPTDLDAQAKIFFDLKRKKKVRFNKEIEVDLFLRQFKYPEEIINSNDLDFIVYKVKNGMLKFQGAIFRHENDSHKKSFYFITKKDISRIQKENAFALFNTLHKLEFENKTTLLKHLAQGMLKTYFRREAA